MFRTVAHPPTTRGVLDQLDAAVWSARRRLSLWTPVAFGAGAGLYFAWPGEPSVDQLWALAGAVTLAAILSIWASGLRFLLVILPVLIGAGFVDAGLRARMVAAPVLVEDFDGTVTGQVVALSRSGSNHPRLLLAEPVLYGVEGAMPETVRITLVDQEDFDPLRPGDWVMTRARIGPPGRPVEPGGFDFRRLAWFQQLGGVGYTDRPVMRFQPGTADRPLIALNQLRHGLAEHIRARIPGDPGAFAAAILTGDRSAVDPAVTEDLRGTNLA
ncbi:MAG: DUF4131 domain-containing protein, partial [Pseudomonadota bacterium]